ncbi:MAG: glycerol-3-phosphate dehydrogenase [Sphingomonadales bacterium]|nr:glycerol-3-phosphate dehydrogenase [Sphingomonadales bacterium]
MYDLLVIGGGINGVGIARDAAGRGLSVALCEKDDLASHTSSASSKLIHGGLRYLENYEFRLVRESLGEREILLRAAPHIIWPMRIVLPVLKGMRPKWMLRIGLFLYDHLAKRAVLQGTKTINLRNSLQGIALKEELKTGFEYSDCWADDSRLVVVNAMDAQERGADIFTRTECTALERDAQYWTATLQNSSGAQRQMQAKMLVNAAGPWVERILGKFGRLNNHAGVRLVKGSHIVTRQLYEGRHGYIFQSADGRIIFAMPYEGDYTLIGTTDTEWELDRGTVAISDEETDYLCAAANDYFKTPVTRDDIVWSYAGVRPLYDDQASSASVVTRDYVFDLEGGHGDAAPILSVFGGKLTTYRKLAVHAMDKLRPFFPAMKGDWTKDAALPGGDFPIDGVEALRAQISTRYPWIPVALRDRLVQAYGTRTEAVLGDARSVRDLGKEHGAGLYDAEIRYLITHEFACSADDILWRRSKLGLKMTEEERESLNQYMAHYMAQYRDNGQII